MHWRSAATARPSHSCSLSTRFLQCLEWMLQSLVCWNIGPAAIGVGIETAEKHGVSFKMAKLSEGHRAAYAIHDARIELADDVNYAVARLVEISPTDIARVGEQVGC